MPAAWTEKYRPKTLGEVVGNGPALKALRGWAEEWRRGPPERRGAILAGEAGVGKTTAALALAREMGWEIVEMNASDQRNAAAIDKVARAGAVHETFSSTGEFLSSREGRKKLIVLDEADNLFGNEDRGGAAAIAAVLRETQQPVLLIVNDLYELQRKSSAIAALALLIKFTRVRKDQVPAALRRIAEAEGIRVDPEVFSLLAEKSGGDLRSAVNDLQALAEGRTRVTMEDLAALGDRDTRSTMYDALGRIFHARTAKEAREATFSLDETPETILLWLDENAPLLFSSPADLSNAYDALARSDVYLGRVIRRQQYGLWSYATTVMTGGIAVTAGGRRLPPVRYQFPQWLSKMSRSRGLRDVRGRTAGKIAKGLHTSFSVARLELSPLVATLMGRDAGFAAICTARFEFEADELAFLLDEKKDAKRVKDLLAEAAKLAVPKAGAFDAYEGGDDEDDDAPAASGSEEDEEDAPAPSAPTPEKEKEKKKGQKGL
ncbi:MAG: replication factor C large subunit, partial [Methanobacteriota archaeon]